MTFLVRLKVLAIPNEIPSSEFASKDLADWLGYIESLHPKSIAMGLDRVNLMIDRLQLQTPFPLITVGGTNGKGSSCAMLEQIYLQAGYRVGCYTSPHILRYNERVRVAGLPVSDAMLCSAFSVVEQARREEPAIALTYFEVGTLAALWHFMQAGVDVAVLEIGLGGRLDAVNAFEPSCTIVTSVDLDHQEFLGDTREAIGYEKAGIFRPGVPAICGDNDPPEALIKHAIAVDAALACWAKDFSAGVENDCWHYQVKNKTRYTLPMPALLGKYQLNNAACAVAAVEALQERLPVTLESMALGLRNLKLAGRFQIIQPPHSGTKHTKLVFDVAHNPHAARALAGNLQVMRSGAAVAQPSKTFAVFAMLADKDCGGVIAAVSDEIDAWYVADTANPRGALANDLAQQIAYISDEPTIKTFASADKAYIQACIDIEACMDANENDKIIVFGSFFTVASVMQLLPNTLCE
ncbi:MAG: bifunctional tetrahydrofolate synthase/dihydrofolate synthase [Methylotenera sp.]|nr:bifunctional tetrahydrofolate synthase/dihydrofolate synthase [Methylotenera sp.]